ncbi:uncharacterized protein L969DRAFT_91479 [Mixia osmundae IAM 14324]|uniref:Uncharacterized protein n=1 Tax=Mixia osmundae (strain CBS 9802 / IAM 14324 / JCM 22182 / KY 12970) TaxID=764103 RepID=G7E407_MIXOS|nr:uncharacterized protein L969DRAFT_91479 [Mixia osmundae IAM 14324]KEI42013.1 hypothetical protein L969DRAFT_91479 [Mixia osmundae IAM 14324]GAA97567.1 hypothetical protein E5Q_04245 [Mixia osmundae IAM 14324]
MLSAIGPSGAQPAGVAPSDSIVAAQAPSSAIGRPSKKTKNISSTRTQDDFDDPSRLAHSSASTYTHAPDSSMLPPCFDSRIILMCASVRLHIELADARASAGLRQRECAVRSPDMQWLHFMKRCTFGRMRHSSTRYASRRVGSLAASAGASLACSLCLQQPHR